MIIDLLSKFKSILSSTLNSSDNRAKIQDSDFIIGLIQAIATANSNFSLSELRLSTCNFLETNIGSSSFNERLGTRSLTKQLETIYEKLISFVSSRSSCSNDLSKKLGVGEIIGVDSTMVSLWSGLKNHFQGTFMEASIKLHMAINLASGEIAWCDTTKGSVHDSTQFPNIIEGNLYLFDLGYWSAKHLNMINNRSAFFLSRIKKNSNFIVTKIESGIGKAAIGKNLSKIRFYKKRSDIIEVKATKKIDNVEVEFRIIGFWNPNKRAYHWYTTNLDSLKELIADLYKCRWQIELSFKAMKSTLSFDRMPTLNANTVQSFTFISLINYILSISIRAKSEEPNSEKNISKKSSILKSAKAYREISKDILFVLIMGKRITKSWLLYIESKLELLLRYVTSSGNKIRIPSIDTVLLHW